MAVQFSVLASGSRGNCSLVRAGDVGLLIDVGLSARATGLRLAGVGTGWGSISGALLTHTHGDHVGDQTLGFMAKHRIPLICNEGHRAALSVMKGFRKLDDQRLVRPYDDRPFLMPGGIRVEPVELMHDGGPTYGFRIELKLDRRSKAVSVGYLADTGCWWDEMADAFTDVDLLGVEFNHDVELQRHSGRSPFLIARNLGDGGHLSNDQGSGLLSAVLDRSRPSKVRDVILLHLSEECNRPDLALGAARRALRESGRRATIHAAQQAVPNPNLLVHSRRQSRPVAAPSGALAFPWEAA
jgi:phosphoribosyl 1,2-cyclic phosphodiesterase